ncbi:BON domain-containing protein (plasmid) [Variovorax sp. V59]|uniref:Osmotically-inducible protein OsmY n=2 Tax=Variovorax TaxID=34072 RepID=A0AAE4BY24_VARPD|nr:MULTISPECIES: BON domain-containing protein [Variovorax]MBD9666975.1 BON domain-containing protein [Variovorax sp. VRV01]MDP9964475.1 osmotically-inducible protein OsmY [Variovorax paradoxus]MDR6427413.1 osmotically-inducible protein OsmY [Variovorax paradoxus]MDR6454575.1 osmotically-inducible protein OsmY [Variovorax paradoxus]TWD85654.1 osmotically-inducible protein OsmY [Variovorax beijingensis]
MKSDTQLRADIQAELAWDPAVSAAGLGVIVNHGVVTLTGHLGSYAEKLAAEQAVLRVGGVKALAVETSVKLAAGLERTDADIAQAVGHALEWNVQVPRDAVRPMVEGGWVTLTGEVDWDYQRRAAESTVRNLLGVTGLTNLVKIRLQVCSADVERQVQDALVRVFHDAPRQVAVDVNGSQVVLRGKVRSWAELEAVRGAAWSAPGVVSVVNELAVEA